MRRLGGIGAAFLYAETPAWHVHVSAVLIIDPSTAPNDGYSFEKLNGDDASSASRACRSSGGP